MGDRLLDSGFQAEFREEKSNFNGLVGVGYGRLPLGLTFVEVALECRLVGAL